MPLMNTSDFAPSGVMSSTYQTLFFWTKRSCSGATMSDLTTMSHERREPSKKPLLDSLSKKLKSSPSLILTMMLFIAPA